MLGNQVWKLSWIMALCWGVSCAANAAEAVKDPCGGDTALLSLIDRPTVGDSACAVPLNHAVLELGYQYQHLSDVVGHQHNFPEAELRFGLPHNNEFVLLIPNYIRQSITPRSGFTSSTIGIKHEIGYNKSWLGSVEALSTLPGGSDAFGNAKVGFAVNGIVSYTLNSKFNLTTMFGVSTETQSKDDGGQRFTSFNPDFVLTYSATDKTQLYGEVYGQTKTGPDLGCGYNFDGGVLFLVRPKLSIDFEVGRRISGTLGGFEYYIGAGVGIMA